VKKLSPEATIRDAIALVEEVLIEADVPSPEIDARRLVSFATGYPLSLLLVVLKEPVREAELDLLAKVVARRAAREPLQWIEEETGFLDFSVECGPGVLIPRFDTETTAEAAIALARRVLAAQSDQDTCSAEAKSSPSHPEVPGEVSGGDVFPVRFLDCGTGSGVLAIALARAFPTVEVCATERSLPALVWASRNVERLAPSIILYDTWFLGAPGDFQLIVGNPPYVSEEEWETLAPEVRLHDPRSALVAQENGLGCLRLLIERGFERLVPGGGLLLEIGFGQAEAVRKLFAENGYVEITTYQDLAGHDRAVSGLRPRELSP